LLWAAFVGCMVVGAAMLLSSNVAVEWVGLGMLLLPLLLLGILTGVYYALERWRARQP
jgi:disulfide bond formation protein DsbB